MIKNWMKFNESSNEPFTLEMAQEIIYYFSEDSKPTQEMCELFYGKHEDIIGTHFTMYETGYDEMNDYIKKLYGLVNTESLEFYHDMIELYHKIREERKDFPKVCEIEDLFLDLIESDKFDFLIYSTKYKYLIKLDKTDNTTTLQDFIKYCNQLNNSLLRLKSDKYNSKLQKCSIQHGWTTWCSFAIVLKSKLAKDDDD